MPEPGGDSCDDTPAPPRPDRAFPLALLIVAAVTASLIFFILHRTRDDSRGCDVDIPYPIATARPAR